MRSLFEWLNFENAELWGGVVYITLFLILLPYLTEVLAIVFCKRGE